MSLATRCPSCGTVFRVVLDQLRVSDGWVRCGRCNSVFNAAEVLFDIDNGTPVHLDFEPDPETEGQPPELTAPPVPQAPDFEPPAPALSSLADLHDATPQGSPGHAPLPGVPDEPDDGLPITVTDWHAAAPAMAPFDGSSIDTPDDSAAPTPDPPPLARAFDVWQPRAISAQPARGFSLGAGGMLRAPSADQDADQDAGHDAAHLPHEPGHSSPVRWSPEVTGAGQPPPSSRDTASAPSFMRSADSAAVWQRPGVRLALVVAAGVLAMAALGQAAWLGRDSLATHYPSTARPLRAMCRLAGCQIQALRQLESLSVDSSALNRQDSGTENRYRLQVTLFNRADIPLMMPALELSLTDAQGKLVSRRVLQMTDLGVSQSALQAGQHLPVQALISAGDLRIDGYTVELFYP